MPAGDPLSYAIAAEENLEKLATELGKLGADEGTLEAVSGWADGVRSIVGVLGKGQQESADDEPAVQEEAAPANYDEAAAATQQMMQGRA